MPIRKQINVNLKDRTYPVYLGEAMHSIFSDVCRQHSISDPVVVITDRNVANFHLKLFKKSLIDAGFQLFTFEIPAGETQKNIKRVHTLITEMLEKRIPRSATVLAFGGGVIGDLTGFVASIYQRGVRLVQIPTTLLAQIDSAIGGKVGINHPLGKNMIGAFYQPLFVWSDIDYLKTLPVREIICGIGEVVKYGIIRSAELFEFLESTLDKVMELDKESILFVVEQCSKIKAEVVSQDERESGLRMILNCGHTIGHGFESAGNYKLLKHGEAILLGLVAESYIASKMGLLDNDAFERILALVNKVPVKVKISSLKINKIFSAISRDKKRTLKKSRFALPVKIGDVKIVEDVDEKLIQEAIKYTIRRG